VRSELAEDRFRKSKAGNLQGKKGRASQKRPKTAKKFATMHYLYPTKSVMALSPELVNCHPQKEIFMPSIKSVKSLKMLKSNAKGKRKSRRLSMNDIP
jgi:hypothetical protein